jgi:hypothetical protein
LDVRRSTDGLNSSGENGETPLHYRITSGKPRWFRTAEPLSAANRGWAASIINVVIN